MYFINVFDNDRKKSWKEEFESYYFFRKRYNKLKFNKKLIITSHSSLVD